MVKNPPAMWETWVQSLGWEDPLEKGMATCSSILAWRISWTEEPGGELHGQRSPWGCKQSGTTEQLSLSLLWELKKQPSSWETIAVSIEHRSMGAGPPAHLPISTLWRPHWGQDDPALPHSKNS